MWGLIVWKVVCLIFLSDCKSDLLKPHSNPQVIHVFSPVISVLWSVKLCFYNRQIHQDIFNFKPFQSSSLSIILLSPVKKLAHLNQGRNMHKSSTIYKQKLMDLYFGQEMDLFLTCSFSVLIDGLKSFQDNYLWIIVMFMENIFIIQYEHWALVWFVVCIIFCVTVKVIKGFMGASTTSDWFIYFVYFLCWRKCNHSTKAVLHSF